MTALEQRLEALEQRVAEQAEVIAELRRGRREFSPRQALDIKLLAQEIHAQGAQRGPHRRRRG